MELALKLSNLSKELKRQKILDNINISVPKGEIYALYGHDRVSKTILLRIIMGLTKPTSGCVELFGKPLEVYKNSCYERIGSILTTQGIYPQLTVYEDLDMHRRLMGVENKEYLEEALELTGLKEMRDRKAKFLTMAMKQKIAIARAILHHPEILVLNDPFDGFDSVDIKEMCKLLYTIWKKRKSTLFISTGLLNDFSGLCNRVGVIREGKLLAEYDQAAIEEKGKKYIKLVVDHDSLACSVLEQKCQVNDYKVIDKGTILIYQHVDKSAYLNKILVENGIGVKEIVLKSSSFEEDFLDLSGEN